MIYSKVQSQRSIAQVVGMIRTNSNVLAVGVAQCLFEAAMYAFVFLWCPYLESFQSTQSYMADDIRGRDYSIRCYLLWNDGINDDGLNCTQEAIKVTHSRMDTSRNTYHCGI